MIEKEGLQKEQALKRFDKQKIDQQIDIRGDGKLIKKLLIEGTGKRPVKDQECLVRYHGMLQNGSTVDSNQEQDEPFKFVLGNHHVIQGWDQAVVTMKVGQKCQVKIHSDLAYGKMGSPPKIPGGANMVFRIELINFHDRRVTKWMMSDQEKIASTLKLKEDGNIKFKQGKYKEAEGFYQDAILHLEQMKQGNTDTQELLIKLYVNIAITNNLVKDYKQARIYSNKAVQKDSKNAKALYNRALAHMHLNMHEQSDKDFKKVLTLNPDDQKVKQEYEKLRKKMSSQLKKEQSMMKNFFDGGVYQDKKVVTQHNKLPPYKKTNPKVFLDINIGETEDGRKDVKGRMIFQLFKNQVPKTVQNFRAICTGEKGEQLWYKGNIFHRIIQNFMMQGGDITNQDGTGGKSIYGNKFDDQPDFLPHSEKGLLSMANAGPNTNGSQFFVTFQQTHHLDKKHIVFGRIIKGREFLNSINGGVKCGANDKPFKDVKIVDCGEFKQEIKDEQIEYYSK